MTLEHVIFDLDGTLIDSAPGIAWSIDEALHSCGLAAADCDVARLIGPPVREILASVSGSAETAVLDQLESGFRRAYDSEGWRRTVCQPGVAEMLWQLLTAGSQMWLLTNKPSLATARILSALKLSGFFQATICRDSGDRHFRSKAEMLSDLLERAHMKRERCLLVGDTAEDWLAARESGISCVIVSHGYGGADLPRDAQRIHEWRELHSVLAKGLEIKA